MPALGVEIGVLDVSPISVGSSASDALRQSVELARLAEQFGYTRFWLAEHHNSDGMASSVPEVLIARIAAGSRRIRVGAGGVMLLNHAPFHVAEAFRLLEALHPGRIDLGLGRALGTDLPTSSLLRLSDVPPTRAEFTSRLSALLTLLEQGIRSDHPKPLCGCPGPDVWLLGASNDAAKLAASLGLGFAGAHFFHPAGACEAVRRYFDHFHPSFFGRSPRAVLAVSVICAETDAEANHLAASLDLMSLRNKKNLTTKVPTVGEASVYPWNPEEESWRRENRDKHVIGSPASVRERLMRLLDASGAAELLVQTLTYDFGARCRSYELLARSLLTRA